MVNHPTTKLEYSPFLFFFRKLQDILTTTPPTSDQFLYIAVNTSVSLCYIMHARSRAFQGPVPFLKLFFLFSHTTTWLSNRKGVFWTSLGFLNVTRISQRPFPAGILGHSSPGQSPLSLSTKVDVVYVAQLLLELWCECFCQAVGAHGTSCV